MAVFDGSDGGAIKAFFCPLSFFRCKYVNYKLLYDISPPLLGIKPKATKMNLGMYTDNHIIIKQPPDIWAVVFGLALLRQLSLYYARQYIASFDYQAWN